MKESDYYHVAPTIERARIKQHGIQQSQPMLNPEWGSQETWADRHGPNPQIPEAVYVWEKPGQAYNYAEQMENGRDTPMDVWRIPGEGAQQDPDIPMARWLPGPVMDPVLHEGPEHRVWDMDRPYEEQWNNYKPLNLNADRDPQAYEELWNQRVGE